jgi:hypothetical protein
MLDRSKFIQKGGGNFLVCANMFKNFKKVTKNGGKNGLTVSFSY